jgi:hypothetical protein
MQKIIVAALLIITTPAAADTAKALAYLANSAGGRIVLTDKTAEVCEGRRIAYSSAHKSDTIFGCWQTDGAMVHIEWVGVAGGGIRSYPIDQFSVIESPGTDT